MTQLFADKFKSDPRVREAEKLIQSALQDVQKEITHIRPPQIECKELQEFEKIRGNTLFYPYLGSGIGNGALVELADGSIKYDLISGIGPHYLGHSHPGIVSSQIDAALQDLVMQGNLQQNRESALLSSLLTSLSGFDHSFLTTSGAMACENSLKIAFHKKPHATRVLAFDKTFSGRTLALSCLTDKAAFRQNLPILLNVDYIPFYDPTRPEESIRELKKIIRRYPNQHAVMCLELVQGEAGFWVGSQPFFKEIIHVLKEHEIAVWVDEVQTFARTEKLFAFQYFGLDDLVDIVSIGKVSQACATLFRASFNPKPGLLSQTFTASTSAIFASLYLITYALKNEFFGPNGKIAKLYKAFIEGLKPYNDRLHGPYGIGAMIACTPYDGDHDKVKELAMRLFHNGVITFTAGSHPARLRLLPPIGVLEPEQIQEICHIIGKSL